jgi:hypothetical protein
MFQAFRRMESAAPLQQDVFAEFQPLNLGLGKTH